MYVQYFLFYSLVCYLRRIYTINKLSGPKTGLCLLWCLDPCWKTQTAVVRYRTRTGKRISFYLKLKKFPNGGTLKNFQKSPRLPSVRLLPTIEQLEKEKRESSFPLSKVLD